MKGKRRGNGDVSYADNVDSELSKPFERKGLKHPQRRGGPGAGEITFYFTASCLGRVISC